jgi:hypothetical protein
MRSWNRCQLKLEKTTIAQLADHLGVDINEIDQKLKLREMIIRVRTRQGLTQSQLYPSFLAHGRRAFAELLNPE